MMKFSSWNISGLGSKRKQGLISNRIKQEALNMIFIQDTNVPFEKLKNYTANGSIILSF